MRERWAIRLAVLTGVLVLALSALFAAVLNPPGSGSTARPAQADAAAEPAAPATARGRAVFEAGGCARCHSVAGVGSPRSPLDGVGARRDREALRQWVTGAPAVRPSLSPRAIEAKQAYAGLPAGDMEALLDYLASLR